MSETIDKNLILDSSTDSDHTDVREMILNAMVNGAYSNSTGSRENTDSTSLAAPDWNSMYADMRRNFGNRNSDSNSIFANENTNQLADDEINGLIWSSLTGEREKDFDRKIEFMPTSADWDRIYSEINKAFGNYSLTGNITNIEPFPINVSSNPYNTYGLATQGYVWYVISRVSGDMGDSVQSVNGVKPDLHRNVDVFKLVTKDYSGEENYVDANLNVLSGGVEYRLITNADLDSSEQSMSSRIDEVSGKVEKISELSGNWENSCFTVESESGNWNSAFSKISESSSDWDATTETVTSFSSNWDSVFTTVQSNSGDWNDAANKEEWDSVYASVHSASAEWSSASTKVGNSSSDWDSVYTTVSSASGDWNSAANKEEWDSVYISVNETSGAWDSVHTTVNSLSAKWDSAYLTLFSTSGSWNNAFSSFSENSGKWDEGSNVAGSVYSSVETASSEWVNSTSKVESSSSDWDSVYTTVLANSGNWELPVDAEKWNSVYSSVIGASGDWENSTSKVESSSGNWDSSYGMATVLSEASGGWEDAAISVQSASSDWVWKSGEVENSAVLKTNGTGVSPFPNVENRAISRFSVSEGASTFSGLKGYRYTDRGDVSGHNYLDFEVNPNGWSNGDVVSVVNNSKYENVLTILSISGNRVNFTTTLPFTSVVAETDFDSYMAYVLAKPDSGNTELGYAAHAEGALTRAANTFTHAEGFATSAFGEYSHAEGLGTIAMHAAHAEGVDTIANNKAEHAQGWFNKSNKASNTFGNAGNTLHSIGIGTSENNRMNAVEVMQDGSVFVKGIGGYDGTNPSTSTSISSKSESWDSVYTTVNSASANWESVYTTVYSASSNWKTTEETAGSVYSSVNAASGGWDSVYSTVLAESASWESAENKDEWDETYETVHSLSAGWTDATTKVSASSSNWDGAKETADSTYTTVNEASAGWKLATSKVESSSANWDESAVVSNSVFLTVESASSNWGLATAKVQSSSGSWDSAKTTADSVYSSVSETSGNWDSVYSTVDSASSGWSLATDKVQSMSGNWDSVYASVESASSGWDEVSAKADLSLLRYDLLDVVNVDSEQSRILSDRAVNSVILTSGSANFIVPPKIDGKVRDFVLKVEKTTLGTISLSGKDSSGQDVSFTDIPEIKDGSILCFTEFTQGKFDISYVNDDSQLKMVESVYSTVEGLSSDWDSVYSTANGLSSNWDSVYSTVFSNSANWETPGNADEWDSVYTTVNSASSDWESVNATVNSLSSNWSSVYSSTFSSSADWNNASTTVQSASGTWETTSNKVSSISPTSDDTQYPTARCLYEIAGTVEEILSSINGDSNWPDMTIFATKVPEATAGDLASLDISGNVADSGIPVSSIASIDLLSESISGKQDVSNLVTTIATTSTDEQYPSAKCMYGVVGDAEAALDAILSGGVSPDLTIFATKAYPATSGHFASLDVSGNIQDSGMSPLDFATKVISATEGNLAALDANGNIIDSKMPSFGLAYSADLRYDLFDTGNWSFYGVPDGTAVSVTESSGVWYFSVSGTDYAATSSDYGRVLSGSITVNGSSYAISSTRFILRDRAVNYLSLSSDQFIGLPEAVPGKARDMLLNLTLVEQTGSVVPVPYLDADVDYETESGEWPDFSAAGRYVVRLTEVMPPVGNANAVFLLQASGASVAANPAAQTNGGGT